MSDKVYVGMVGIPLIVQVGDGEVNLSQANQAIFFVKKPNNTVVQWTPTVVDAKTLQYLVKKGDLDQHGTYIVQAYLQIKSLSGYTGIASFPVYKQFE